MVAELRIAVVPRVDLPAVRAQVAIATPIGTVLRASSA